MLVHFKLFILLVTPDSVLKENFQKQNLPSFVVVVVGRMLCRWGYRDMAAIQGTNRLRKATHCVELSMCCSIFCQRIM